jgi:hypothetical protein
MHCRSGSWDPAAVGQTVGEFREHADRRPAGIDRGHCHVRRDFLLLEYRNLYYSTDKPDSHALRVRNRIEALWPINRQMITNDGATSLSIDRSRNTVDEPFTTTGHAVDLTIKRVC